MGNGPLSSGKVVPVAFVPTSDYSWSRAAGACILCKMSADNVCCIDPACVDICWLGWLPSPPFFNRCGICLFWGGQWWLHQLGGLPLCGKWDHGAGWCSRTGATSAQTFPPEPASVRQWQWPQGGESHLVAWDLWEVRDSDQKCKYVCHLVGRSTHNILESWHILEKHLSKLRVAGVLGSL